MKLKTRSSNNTGASPKGNLTSFPAKKRKLGKNESRWFNIKSCFLGLGVYVAFVACLLSHYWPSNLHNVSSKTETKNVNLDSLINNYTLPCEILSQSAISAINRASSPSCKQRIAEVACQSVDAPDGVGNLYPTHMPNFCPTENIENTALGKRLFKETHIDYTHYL